MARGVWRIPPEAEFDVDGERMRFWMLTYVCGNPRCGCRSVKVLLSKDGRRIEFDLDVETGGYSCKDCSPADRRVVDAFVEYAKCSDSKYNMGVFREMYGKAKDSKKVASAARRSFRPGRMLAYPDFFGPESDIKVEIGGENYLVFDAYCVMPACRCTESAVGFVPTPKAGEHAKIEFSFLYDYVSGGVRDTAGVSEGPASEIAKKFFTEEIRQKLKARHAELKELVEPAVIRRIERAKRAESQKPAAWVGEKLGRNDPCHCGSGKKYKKCCLGRRQR